MKKVKLYIATSLNGYIAKTDHSVDWLNEIPTPKGEDYGYIDFYNSCSVTIQGNNTYNFILNSGHDFPYKTTENYVFTRNVNLRDNHDVKFISKDHIAFIEALKKEDGKDIWLIGGGQINAIFFDNDLIDEIWIHVMPIVLEDGIKLSNRLSKDIRLELLSTRSYSSGVIEMKYKVN